jgi:predicted AAA+ superfamily ATPase
VSTLKRYLALLETLELPAWASNRGERLARAPKLHIVDTGLAAALAGMDADLVNGTVRFSDRCSNRSSPRSCESRAAGARRDR